MLKLFARCLLLACLLSSFPLIAQEKPPLVGTGAHQCSVMLSNCKKEEYIKESYTQWVFGFMSSLALVHSQPVFDLSNPEEIWLAIKTICEKNPNQHVFEATSVVYLQLLEILLNKK